MKIISKEDVLNIAKMSHISLHEPEIDVIAQQISAVLSYAVRVKEVTIEIQETIYKNSNVMRDDNVTTTDAKKILEQAVDYEANYFVVPAIIENK